MQGICLRCMETVQVLEEFMPVCGDIAWEGVWFEQWCGGLVCGNGKRRARGSGLDRAGCRLPEAPGALV